MLSTEQHGSHFAKTEFEKRRQHLLHTLGENSIAIVAAAQPVARNNDANYPYRQNSDFYYLTGFNEPEAVALLIPGRLEGEYLLFNREHNVVEERWEGYRAGQEGACQQYGAEQSFPIQHMDALMPELLLDKTIIYYSFGRNSAFDMRLMRWINEAEDKAHHDMQVPQQLIHINTLLHEQRLLKSPVEIELMRQAAQISAQAHQCVMQVCRPGMYEYELEAELLHVFYRRGSRFPAYTSIVASGENACTLHYVQNNRCIEKGDLVLVDAGAEYEHYASDITRTFPASGKFSKEQAAIYDVVLAAQMAGIEQVQPGNAWESIQKTIVEVISQGLLDVGILQGDLNEIIETKAYRNLYMHGSGHWLGLDVHDVGNYYVNGESRQLSAGMVLTVEPGIYISRGSTAIDEKWWGIGVRIEDDVVVTALGKEVLSGSLAKERKEIEALVGRRK